MTNAGQIGVDWATATSTQAPGGNVKGYILYIMDPRYGQWVQVFNGEQDYPTVTSYIVRQNISGGLPYRFKVVAAYLNGYSPASSESMIYSCTQPADLGPPTLVLATSTAFTLQWKQPLDNGGCSIEGFALYINGGTGD